MKEISLRILGDSTILVGDVEVGPGASHLFALLLLLTLAPPQGTSRRELQELLFGPADEDKTSHRLRQLLYRLRQLGVVFRETAAGAVQVTNPITGPAATTIDRSSGTLRALPHYHPRLPKPFLAWLESSREGIEHAAQTRIVRQLREAHSRQDWSTTSGLAEVVLLTDPLNEEVATVGAESRAMLGQRDEALEIADRFVRDIGGDDPAARAMRTLRARIARTAVAHREGALRGREECLAFLAAQWEAAARGGGRASLIVGPPGMGKTRVAEAFATKVRLGGGRVVSYQCDRQASQHPLALFSAVLPELQALPGSLGISPEHRVVLERLGPPRSAPVEELPGQAAVEARRVELQRALIDLLGAVSAERPLLLVIDDTHLLDDASCEVLAALADLENDAAVLVAAFTRPRTDGSNRLTQARRTSSYLLPPLSGDEARDLLLELRSGRTTSEEQIAWTLSQAKGNPFYLYALASVTSEQSTLPAHVRSLASCAYLSLTPPARTVLESCLLLDTLATLKRVRRIVGIDEPTLSSVLRELEELDLVHFDAGRLRGPHAILDETLRQMIPGSVSAFLHMRIAESLAEECLAGDYSSSLAWAAVRSWLAAGEPRAAVALACRAAREAAALGEPHTGAELLSQIPRIDLPPECQREVLDDLYRLANAGDCQSLLVEALKERMALAVALQEGPQTRAVIELNAINNAIWRRRDGSLPFGSLQAMLYDTTLETETRIVAGRRLIALADDHFDFALASTTYGYLCDICNTSEPAFSSAALIYHTVFGESERARALITTIASRHIALDETSRGLTTNALLALNRLGHYAEARNMSIQTVRYMTGKGLVLSTEIAIAMIAEAELALGNLESATHWVHRWEQLAEQKRTYQSSYYSGYFSTKFLTALYGNCYPEAERVFAEHSSILTLNNPRHRAARLAFGILLQYWVHRSPSRQEEVRELEILYERGRSFGAQDSCVEALWCAATVEGRAEDASKLLGDYLNIHRRERTLPEWGLRRTTAIDPVWQRNRFTHGLANAV